MIERAFNIAKRLKENYSAAKQFAIAQAWETLEAAGVLDPRLETERVDLRQQTYDLLGRLRKPSSDEKEALEERDIKFFSVTSISYAQVVAENPEYFRDKELENANATPELRDYALPVAVEVGLRRPEKLHLAGSFGKSRETQLQMAEDYSQELQKQFPNIPNIRAIILPSTGYAQVDKACKAETGEVLIRNFYARALDNSSVPFAACVGRGRPEDRLEVVPFGANDGLSLIAAVPAIVFLRK